MKNHTQITQRISVGLLLLLFLLPFGTVNEVAAKKSSVEAIDYTYQGGLLSDVKGKVKSVDVKGSPFGTTENLKFLENGKIRNRLMSYDKEGRPIGYGMNNGATYAYMTVTYSPEGRVATVTNISKLDAKDPEATITRTYTYDGEVMVQLIDQVVDNVEGAEATEKVYTYSDYEYDDQGNWISRKIKTSSPNNPDWPGEEYTEIRTIKYY